MQAQITAKDMSSLCEQFSAREPLSEMSLGKRTVAFESSAPGANMLASWQKVNMRPSKKIVPQNSATTQAGMAGMAADFAGSPIDQYFLGNLAGKLDGPTPDYSPGVLFMEPCTDSSVVYVMSGKNKKLAEGTLQLGPRTFLVLDASCSGVELKNMTIEGYSLTLLNHGHRTLSPLVWA